MPYTIVIADDVTGANDIGIMYAKAGLTALVYSYGEIKDYEKCDVLILDTDSRFDTKEKAYEKVSHALEQCPKEGVSQYINKQCSVFRGNIGAEFDAMLDTLQEDFAVVVLGFPNNGRTTIHSEHYVFGTALADSQFCCDPVHPMTKSNLVEILSEQTTRKVGAIHYEVYQQGKKAVERALAEAKEKYNYCIMDVRDNGDLEFLAEILQEEKVICGSSALSEYLAIRYVKEHDIQLVKKERFTGEKVFCMAGSLTPQTLAQTSYMKEQGYPVFEVDTRKLFTEMERLEESIHIESLVNEVYETGGRFAMIHSMNRPDNVKKTKEIAEQYGIDNTQVSSLVSTVLAQISHTVIKKNQIENIIICGGDTSAALCGTLKVRGMKIVDEIEAGLPTCQSVDAPYYKMVLKSGSFGSEEFIEKAMAQCTGKGV